MEITKRLDIATNIVDEFLSGHKHYFSNLKPSDIPDKLPGVYAIFNTSETLYVGRTKNLRQRIYNNHLMGPLSNARLKKYLIEDNVHFPDIVSRDMAKIYLKENCFVQYVSIDTVIERGRIEGLLSYALNVKYLYEEH
jgi:hypothetical protein